MSAFRSVKELVDDLEGQALFIFVGNEFVCVFGGFRLPYTTTVSYPGTSYISIFLIV